MPALFRISRTGSVPSIAQAAGLLSLNAGDLDAAYGVATLDRKAGSYVVLVLDSALGRVVLTDATAGPFTDLRDAGLISLRTA